MTDCDGKTALHLSCSDGHYDVVVQLLRAGANVNLVNLQGRTPLRINTKSRSLYIRALENDAKSVEFLLNHGANNIVQVLLLNGADVNSVDGGSRSALLSACWQGHLHIADILLTAGAEVNQQCCQGASPLAVSAQEGHIGVLKLLLQHGADPTLQDHHGRDPYRVALEISRNDFPPLYTGHIKWFDKNQSQGVIEYQDQGVMNYCHISSDEVERDVSSDDLVVFQITDNPKYGKTATNVFVSAKGMKRHEKNQEKNLLKKKKLLFWKIPLMLNVDLKVTLHPMEKRRTIFCWTGHKTQKLRSLFVSSEEVKSSIEFQEELAEINEKLVNLSCGSP